MRWLAACCVGHAPTILVGWRLLPVPPTCEAALGPDKESDMAGKARQTLKSTLEDKLDQALEDSFPASDPVSFIEPAPGNVGDKKTPVVKAAGQAKPAHKGKGKATRS